LSIRFNKTILITILGKSGIVNRGFEQVLKYTYKNEFPNAFIRQDHACVMICMVFALVNKLC
jgi:hypothetical protein